MWFPKLLKIRKKMAKNFLGTAEVAFVGNISPSTLHQVAEDGLLPRDLYEMVCGERRFRRFAGVLARLNLELEDVLVVDCRKRVFAAIYCQVQMHAYPDKVLDLQLSPAGIDWQVPLLDFVNINPGRHLSQAFERAAKVETAAAKVVLKNSAGAGVLFFKNTDIPVESIVNLFDEAQDFTSMKAIYPALTAEHVWVAHVYRQIFGDNVSGVNNGYSRLTPDAKHNGLTRE